MVQLENQEILIPWKFTFGLLMDVKFISILVSIVGLGFTILVSTSTFAFYMGRLSESMNSLKEETKKDMNAAHEKIRELKTEVIETRKILQSQR